MIVTQVPVTLALPESRSPRSQGVHVSSIIRCIATEAGILKPEWVEELSLIEVKGSSQAWWDRLDEVAKIRISLGLAWEEFYIPTLTHVVDHPGEMQTDGIFMTHDGESLDVVLTERGVQQQILAVHEVKCTFKSMNQIAGVEFDYAAGSYSYDLSGQWMWLSQMKSYCRGLHTLRAYLHVLFLCGDYSFPISPRLLCFQVDFTQDEIDDNWSLLTAYRDAHLEGFKP